MLIVHEKKLLDQSHKALYVYRQLFQPKRHVAMRKDPLINCFWIQWMRHTRTRGCYAGLAKKKKKKMYVIMLF